MPVADARYCACAAGYVPVGDECVGGDGGNPCELVTCEGHGTCRLVDGTPDCDCAPGYEELVPLHCIQPPPDGGPPDDGRDGDAGGADADVEDGTPPPPGCGNGSVGGTEQCDDGNRVSGDGCEPDCRFTCGPLGACAAGGSCLNCVDLDPCTDDSCIAGGDGQICSNVSAPGNACDDGNPCTDGDVCDAAGECRSGPDACGDCTTTADCAPHEDGDRCNGTLWCTDGRSCAVEPGTVVTCDTSGDNECRHTACVPATGVCSTTVSLDGTSCGSGGFCGGGSCQDGVCASADGPCALPCETCNETLDRCDVAAGSCRIEGACWSNGAIPWDRPCLVCSSATNPTGWTTRAGMSCDNGTYCDGADTCDAAGACVGSGVNPCPNAECWVCDEFRHLCASLPTSTVCREAVGPCDLPETCTAVHVCPTDLFYMGDHTCRPSIDPICDPAEVCSGSSSDCPPDYNEPTSVGCDDGDSCTYGDHCSGFGWCDSGSWGC
jgi:cysteine-rich repeat protein